MFQQRLTSAIMLKKKRIAKRTAKSQTDSVTITDLLEVALVRLLKSSSTLMISAEAKPSAQISLNYTVTLNEGKKYKVALVDVGCNVTVHADGIPDAHCTQIFAVYQVVFAAKDEFPELSDKDRNVLLASGSVVAWPYLRSFIQTNVSLMGLRPVVLPLFHPIQGGTNFARIAETDVSAGQDAAVKKRVRESDSLPAT